MASKTTSHNGYPGIPSARDKRLTVIEPAPGRKIRVRAGDVATILDYVARRFHTRVESLTELDGPADEWGYAYRKVRGGRSLSNHASGTAIDLNATRHPFRTKATRNFSRAQIRECESIVAACGGTVRWLSGHDPMHWEIAPIGRGGSPSQLARVATRLRGELPPITSPHLRVDGALGPVTISVLRESLGEKSGSIITRSTVSALQRRLKIAGVRDWQGRTIKVDGRGFGSNVGRRYPRMGRTRTVWALQRLLGIPRPDGALSRDESATVMALQRRLNNGRKI